MLLRIGEVRSLIPTSVHVMALTATATRSDISFISRSWPKKPICHYESPSNPKFDLCCWIVQKYTRDIPKLGPEIGNREKQVSQNNHNIIWTFFWSVW